MCFSLHSDILFLLEPGLLFMRRSRLPRPKTRTQKMALLWNKIWRNPFWRSSNSATPRGSYCEQYALITSRQDVINFDPTRSVALCIGIDQQYHKNYECKSLGVPAANDANNMGEAFVTKLGINQDQVQVFCNRTILQAQFKLILILCHTHNYSRSRYQE